MEALQCTSPVQGKRVDHGLLIMHSNPDFSRVELYLLGFICVSQIGFFSIGLVILLQWRFQKNKLLVRTAFVD